MCIAATIKKTHRSDEKVGTGLAHQTRCCNVCFTAKGDTNSKVCGIIRRAAVLRDTEAHDPTRVYGAGSLLTQ